MSTENQNITVKNLPEAITIGAGDFMIVENPFGTNIIDFENFIIGHDNITFGAQLTAYDDDIAILKTNIKTLSTTSVNWQSYEDSADRAFILSSIGINVQKPTEALCVAGGISATGTISATGDTYSYFKTNVSIGTPIGHQAQLTVQGVISCSNLYARALSADLFTMSGDLSTNGGLTANGFIRFGTNDSGLVWNQDLNAFAIGGIHPTATLTVYGDMSGNGGLSAGGKSFLGGDVGIGTSNPWEKLTVVGHVSSTGSVYTSAGDLNDVIALIRANSASSGWTG